MLIDKGLLMDMNICAVSKRYRMQQVLYECSLTVHAGEIVVLTGENGCGKSTFLSLVLGYEKPDSGVIIAPRLGAGLSGYVNKPVLFPDMSGSSNIRFFMELSGKKYERNICMELMERLGLRDDKKHASTYSTGMLKKYGILRSLLTQSESLVFDEPFSGLDDAGCTALYDLLSDYVTKNRSAVLMTVHGNQGIENKPVTAYQLKNGKIYSGTVLQDKVEPSC
jgi:ABC-2 type transport system ATP-binding protein